MGHRWIAAASNSPTGQVDKNGREIWLSDQVKYRRKVPAQSKCDYRRGTIETTPGHYQWITAIVTGFGRAVQTRYDGTALAIEYIVVKDCLNQIVTRIYRTDLTEVVNDK